MQGPSTDLEPVLPTGQRTWHPAGKKELPMPFTGRRGPLLCTRQAQGQLQGPGWLAEARLAEQEAAQGPASHRQAAGDPEGVQGAAPPGEKPACAVTSPLICRSLCITLGELLAQLPGCPQRKAVPGCCPRWRDSRNRVRHTGFSATQVLATTGKNALVHTKCRALLLRLCIYKDYKKKTGNNIPRPARASQAGTTRCAGEKKPQGVLRPGSGEMRRGLRKWGRRSATMLPFTGADCAGRPPARPQGGVG